MPSGRWRSTRRTSGPVRPISAFASLRVWTILVLKPSRPTTSARPRAKLTSSSTRSASGIPASGFAGRDREAELDEESAVAARSDPDFTAMSPRYGPATIGAYGHPSSGRSPAEERRPHMLHQSSIGRSWTKQETSQGEFSRPEARQHALEWPFPVDGAAPELALAAFVHFTSDRAPAEHPSRHPPDRRRRPQRERRSSASRRWSIRCHASRVAPRARSHDSSRSVRSHSRRSSISTSSNLRPRNRR